MFSCLIKLSIEYVWGVASVLFLLRGWGIFKGGKHCVWRRHFFFSYSLKYSHYCICSRGTVYSWNVCLNWSRSPMHLLFYTLHYHEYTHSFILCIVLLMHTQLRSVLHLCAVCFWMLQSVHQNVLDLSKMDLTVETFFFSLSLWAITESV